MGGEDINMLSAIRAEIWLLFLHWEQKATDRKDRPEVMTRRNQLLAMVDALDGWITARKESDHA